MDYNAYNPQNELIYDLRQTYAEIVSEVLKGIAMARREKNFASWFDFLEDLHTEIHQKLTKKEREEHSQRIANTIQVINKHPLAFQGKFATATERYVLYKSLKELELWLRDMMEKHKMFGAKEEITLS